MDWVNLVPPIHFYQNKKWAELIYSPKPIGAYYACSKCNDSMMLIMLFFFPIIILAGVLGLITLFGLVLIFVPILMFRVIFFARMLLVALWIFEILFFHDYIVLFHKNNL